MSHAQPEPKRVAAALLKALEFAETTQVAVDGRRQIVTRRRHRHWGHHFPEQVVFGKSAAVVARHRRSLTR